MNAQLSNAKEIRIPGPDHPITISPAEGKVRVTVAGRIVAESLFTTSRATVPICRCSSGLSHSTYCPYKGDCAYYSIPIGGVNAEYAVWTYEKPYEAVADIKEYLAF